MTTSVAIVIALVVLAVVVIAVLARGKGASQLQAPPGGIPQQPPPPRPPPSKRPPQAPEAEAPKRSERPQPPQPPPSTPSSAPSPEALVPSAPPAQAPAEAPALKTSGAPAASVPPSKRDVAGLRKGLAASRGGFIARLTALFQGKKEIDPAILEQVEEVMLASDVGPKTTQAILGRLREALGRNELADNDAVWAALRAEALRILDIGGGAVRTTASPTVVLMVGVNGVGKTTT